MQSGTCVVAMPAASCAWAPAAWANERHQWGNVHARFVYGGHTIPEPAEIETGGRDGAGDDAPLLDKSLFVDAESRGIANILFWMTDTDQIPVHPAYAATANDDATLRIERFQYTPRVLVLRLSQRLVIDNTDEVGYSPTIAPIGNPGFSMLVAGRRSVHYQFTRRLALPTVVSCTIHPWMRAYLLATDHPYASVSGTNGAVGLKNVPTGNWQFHIWHERAGLLRQVVHNGESL